MKLLQRWHFFICRMTRVHSFNVDLTLPLLKPFFEKKNACQKTNKYKNFADFSFIIRWTWRTQVLYEKKIGTLWNLFWGISAGTNFCRADHRVIQAHLRVYRSQPVSGLSEEKWICQNRSLIVFAAITNNLVWFTFFVKGFFKKCRLQR